MKNGKRIEPPYPSFWRRAWAWLRRWWALWRRCNGGGFLANGGVRYHSRKCNDLFEAIWPLVQGVAEAEKEVAQVALGEARASAIDECVAAMEHRAQLCGQSQDDEGAKLYIGAARCLRLLK
jgi:hypothetical protein